MVPHTSEPVLDRPALIDGDDVRRRGVGPVLTEFGPQPDRDAGRALAEPDVIYRHLEQAPSSWIADTEGVRRPLHLARWLGGTASTEEDRAVDETMLDLCTGPTVDVGCGPGRFTAGLAQRGTLVLGVDVSLAAVEMTKRRGGPALHSDVFDRMPGVGRWHQVLLADGNIGIGGDPRRMLRRARQLVRPDGQIIVELETPAVGLRTKVERWETPHHVGRWFSWTHVGTDAIAGLVSEVGLAVVEVIERCGRCIVVLAAAS